MVEQISLAAVLVTQGKRRFYTLTMDSDLLKETCVAATREEDSIEGFQRLLDRKRAEDIAKYIDNDFGTIPQSIILSAQEGAELLYSSKNKTIEFNITPNSFLILDGQHRVYGFHLAESKLRVPVVVYNGLSRTEETRLFIDVNTKQQKVPTALLLDIKHLANIEDEIEEKQRILFDHLNTNSSSPLFGRMSPTKTQKGKINRNNFGTASKPIVIKLDGKSAEDIYFMLSAFYSAFISCCSDFDSKIDFYSRVPFVGISKFFLDVTRDISRMKNGEYSADNYYSSLVPMFEGMPQNPFRNTPKGSGKEHHRRLKELYEHSFDID